jgi:hypothetical protein
MGGSDGAIKGVERKIVIENGGDARTGSSGVCSVEAWPCVFDCGTLEIKVMGKLSNEAILSVAASVRRRQAKRHGVLTW